MSRWPSKISKTGTIVEASPTEEPIDVGRLVDDTEDLGTVLASPDSLR